MTLGRMKSFTPATPIKAGARHSASDFEHMQHTRSHAKQIMEHMAALGVEEDEPAAPPTKAGAVQYARAGAIKALGPYTLRVKGIVRGGRDLVGDTFTRETDHGLSRSPVGMPAFYDHALGAIKSQIGVVTAWEDTGDSIDFVIELDKAKAYADEIMALYSEKALGASTGAAGHLVVRQGGILKRWVISEISLTPRPAEPRTRPTKALPALPAAAQRIYDLMRQKYTAYQREDDANGWYAYQGLEKELRLTLNSWQAADIDALLSTLRVDVLAGKSQRLSATQKSDGIKAWEARSTELLAYKRSRLNDTGAAQRAALWQKEAQRILVPLIGGLKFSQLLEEQDQYVNLYERW